MSNEASPYLQQHAYNPVDWYPWGDEAFETAERLDRPIFLSIGYSSCHWCHVMERECFEDDEVAELMNSNFVNIKVDREERPDIDSIYMKACSLMTGGGGWPLTIIMTPDKVPFYAGTYIPRSSVGGTPGMVDLIPAIRSAWKDKRGEIGEVALKIKEMMVKLQDAIPSGDIGEVGRSTVDDLANNFEERYGGFELSPKFPTTQKSIFLLRWWRSSGDQSALGMAERTLEMMARGGIHDHIGGGFHRYSTDSKWFVPHFEKMLCDQAMISLAYTEAYQATGSLVFREAAAGTFDYVLRDLSDPDGGFYSSEDADSKDGEGAFYTWTYDDFAGALSKDDLPMMAEIYDVRKGGNFRAERGSYSGLNVLHMPSSLNEFASAKNVPIEPLHETVHKARRSLFRTREKRERPALDDKVLLDWNGLMIAALAKGGRGLGNPKYIERAAKAVQFIESRMRAADEGLLHRYREGGAGIEGMLSDHANYCWGLIELYQATMEPKYLKLAETCADQMNDKFGSGTGGFWSSVGKDLISKEMEIYDGPVPSGNSVALYVNMAMGELTQNDRYAEIAKRTAERFSGTALSNPSAHCFYSIAVQMLLGGASVVTMRKDPRGLADEEIRGAVDAAYAPEVLMRVGDVNGDERSIAQLCRSKECLPAVRDLGTLKEQLRI